MKSRFEDNFLPIDIIQLALEQYAEIQNAGGVCLSHFNEPLMDPRIVTIAELAKSFKRFDPIYLNTNGDYLTKELAASLDGVLDKIKISMYANKSKRHYKLLESFFKKTEVELLPGPHVTTHFSPRIELEKSIWEVINTPCTETKPRIIISHNQQYLLCCEDLVGKKTFGLGRFPSISLKEYWYGKRHITILKNLDKPGGRKLYPYCSICPRV